MKLAVLGTGYVGLVSAVCLAELGVEVVCIDTNTQKVEKINRGLTPIHEKGIEALLRGNIGSRLTATGDADTALRQSDVSMIAVGTPFDGNRIDLAQIETAARTIGRMLRTRSDYHVVVVKSTVVPGTTLGIVRDVLEAESNKKAGSGFGLVMNPEFLREGEAVEDFMNPDRIVIGGLDQRSIDTVRALYARFVARGVPFFETTCTTAEMIKYANNSLFATLISFSNEVGNLCARLPGLDVQDVMTGVYMDKRLTPRLPSGEVVRPQMLSYLAAGCGFGGSCFPKDVQALAAHSRMLGVTPHMLDAVIAVNSVQWQELIRQAELEMELDAGRRVSVLGLAFKPESDDVRESPAIPLIEALVRRGCKVTAYDPLANGNFQRAFPDWPIRYASTLAEAVDAMEAVLVVTRWREFGDLPAIVAGMQAAPIVVDGRRMFQEGAFPRYTGIGFQAASRSGKMSSVNAK